MPIVYSPNTAPAAQATQPGPASNAEQLHNPNPDNLPAGLQAIHEMLSFRLGDGYVLKGSRNKEVFFFSGTNGRTLKLTLQ